MGPRTLSPDSGELDGELLDAARELQEGQCSGILESQEGFSILRRLETDPEALREPYLMDWIRRHSTMPGNRRGRRDNAF